MIFYHNCCLSQQLLASMCHTMPFSAHALEKNIFFDVDIVVKKQIEMWFSVVCTLIDNYTRHHSGQYVLWSVLLSTTIRVITVVKMLWTHEAQKCFVRFSW